MRKILIAFCWLLAVFVPALAETLCIGSSPSVAINQTIGSRLAAAREMICYSSAWASDASDAVAEVAVNGVVFKSATGLGMVEWTPTRNGTYTLTHVVKVDGVQVGETLSATFVVEGLNPENPVIMPASGTTFDSSLTVSMSCALEGATIHYTTDGSEPTMDSPVYKRFRVNGKTTVKARAFYENGSASEIVTAEYALGRCANPVISGVDSFMGKRRKVSIACATEDAVVRYTTNGTVPNSHSARYTGPFYVTDTCTVKAVAFKSEWFDSSVVSHGVTRIRGLGDSVGLPDQVFATSGAAGWADADGSSLKSGTIGNNQQSVLSTTFVGKGQLTFRWKTSCEEDEELHDWDHVVFKVDGKEITRQDGQTDWLEVAHTIKTAGSHKAEWIYVKDDFDGEGEDCAWLKDVVWMPEMTQTTEVPVPTAWLKETYPTLDDYYFDYEEQANETAANGTDPVWACYVTGVDPTDALSWFVAYIAMDGETPVVTWSPDLNEGAGKVGARIYTIMGSDDLKTWSETAAGKEGDFHFFKVKVALP